MDKQHWENISDLPIGYKIISATRTFKDAESERRRLLPEWRKTAEIKKIDVVYNDGNTGSRIAVLVKDI